MRPEQVHKRVTENVLLTSYSTSTESRLMARFDVPTVPGSLRLADLIEVQRQAGILQVHEQLNVPVGDVVTLMQLRFWLLPAAAGRISDLAEGVVRSDLVRTARSGRTVKQRFSLEINGVEVAQGDSVAAHFPQRLYERLRTTRVEGLEKE